MAGSSLLTLIDDIATLLDDIALLSKVAAKKTAGVLGDDLALNAEQVAGIRAEREIPVVWAVAKGSFKNKLILVPAALLISATIPWLITPLLMLGGAYLCFEGFEKIAHHWLQGNEQVSKQHDAEISALADPKVDLVTFEKEKIKGAVRTDFVLSAEIIVIALGTVQEAAFATQVAVVSGIAVIITVAVYGLVGGIVKIDDAGYYLIRTGGQNFWAASKRRLGRGLLAFAPFLMRSLSVVGTAAMFLVGGGILLHGLSSLEPLVHHVQDLSAQIPAIGEMLSVITPSVMGAITGLVSGAILVALMILTQRLTGGASTEEQEPRT